MESCTKAHLQSQKHLNEPQKFKFQSLFCQFFHHSTFQIFYVNPLTAPLRPPLTSPAPPAASPGAPGGVEEGGRGGDVEPRLLRLRGEELCQAVHARGDLLQAVLAVVDRVPWMGNSDG